MTLDNLYNLSEWHKLNTTTTKILNPKTESALPKCAQFCRGRWDSSKTGKKKSKREEQKEQRTRGGGTNNGKKHFNV